MIDLTKAQKEFIRQLETAGKTPATLIAYENDIFQLAEHLYKQGVASVHEISLAQLEGFTSKLAQAGMTNKTISRKINAIKTFFKFLVSKNHIQVNVADNLKHPTVSIKAPRILSKLEYKALRDTVKADVRTKAIIEVLLQTGITISELAGIEKNHLELVADKALLSIPTHNSRISRKIPLNKAVTAAIKEYLTTERTKIEGSDQLFVSKTGNPLLVRNIRSTLDRYFKLAGLKKAKVNDLRHTFVAHQLAAGVDLNFLSGLAGHKRLSTTQKYVEHVKSFLAEELEAVKSEAKKMELVVL